MTNDCVKDFVASNHSTSFFANGIGQHFTDLHGLTFVGSKLKFIEKRNFEHMQKLRELWLDENEIEELPSDTFQYLKNLEKLSLSKNKMKALHDDLFVRLPLLKYFAADRNQLQEITESLFERNENLSVLSVKRNKLMRIAISFDDFPKLRKVDFRYNLCVDICVEKRQLSYFSCDRGSLGKENFIEEIERICWWSKF